ncbi:MAG: glycosyltransferase, partial [Candidatus Nanopelagicaceae bacterium]
MITTNPDKHIRKAIFDLLNDIEVSGKTIKCFDSRITGNAKLLNYILLTAQIIKQFKPDVVIGTGGFASGPLLQMANNAGIPTVIQEQNSFPGITNKL